MYQTKVKREEFALALLFYFVLYITHTKEVTTQVTLLYYYYMQEITSHQHPTKGKRKEEDRRRRTHGINFGLL